MSYEGYRQQICTAGHYSIGDDGMHAKEEGCHCGNQIAWANSVDETNGDSFGLILKEVLDRCFLLKPEVRKTCDMGHSHLVEPAVYRIPLAAAAKLRTYRGWVGGGTQKTVPLASVDTYNQTITHFEERLKSEKQKLTS